MTRRLPEFEVPPAAPGAQPEQGGTESAGQSGDTQGLSQTADASDETVEELVDTGQDYEAGIQAGVENAADHPERPVPSHDGQERRAAVAGTRTRMKRPKTHRKNGCTSGQPR